jgi:hypothetical protein
VSLALVFKLVGRPQDSRYGTKLLVQSVSHGYSTRWTRTQAWTGPIRWTVTVFYNVPSTVPARYSIQSPNVQYLLATVPAHCPAIVTTAHSTNMAHFGAVTITPPKDSTSPSNARLAYPFGTLNPGSSSLGHVCVFPCRRMCHAMSCPRRAHAHAHIMPKQLIPTCLWNRKSRLWYQM